VLLLVFITICVLTMLYFLYMGVVAMLDGELSFNERFKTAGWGLATIPCILFLMYSVLGKMAG